MDKIQNVPKDEALIRNLVEDWARAVRSKNIEGILRYHSPNIVMFDVPPPFQSKGIKAYRKTWDLSFRVLIRRWFLILRK